MLPNRECLWMTGKTYCLLSTLNKSRRFKLEPFRCYCKFDYDKKELKPINKSSDDSELPPLSGVNDPNFSEFLKRNLTNVNAQKTGFKNLWSHMKQFYKERAEDLRTVNNQRVDRLANRIDIVHKFETVEDLKGFRVNTDSAFSMGYSSASFKLTENETAIFSGNIDTTVPRTGTVSFSGFANLTGPKQRRAFFRAEPYDWTDYTHLVFKIRGDGRTYLVILHTPKSYDEMYPYQFCHPLHTRGGPYWQIMKIPFAHFFSALQGKLQDIQHGVVALDNILNIGLTVGAYEGPFKLEIDYIGLEFMEYQKKHSPYELYAMKR